MSNEIATGGDWNPVANSSASLGRTRRAVGMLQGGRVRRAQAILGRDPNGVAACIVARRMHCSENGL